MDTSTIIISLIGALIGALIGTFCGAYLINKFQEDKTKRIRQIAYNALDLIRKYAKNSNVYSEANKEFNNSLNISEKRAVLVCLHKLGIPIETNAISGFDINNIGFTGTKIIDAHEITLMKLQIDKGNCDHLFFLDVDSYFASGMRIKTIRNIAKKYVSNVLEKTKYIENYLKYPDGWASMFSLGELNTLWVFIENVRNSHYFDKQTGYSVSEKIAQLSKEIDIGLWDMYLQWDYDDYKNTLLQAKSAEGMLATLSSAKGIFAMFSHGGSQESLAPKESKP